MQNPPYSRSFTAGIFIIFFFLIPLLISCSSQQPASLVTEPPPPITPTVTLTIPPTLTHTPTFTLPPTDTATPAPTDTPTLTPTPYQLSYGRVKITDMYRLKNKDVIENNDQLTLRKTIGLGRAEKIYFTPDNEIVVIADMHTCFLDAFSLQEKRCFSTRRNDGYGFQDQWIAISRDQKQLFIRKDSSYEFIDTTTGDTALLDSSGIERWSFSPDGKWLATNTGIFDTETRKLTQVFRDEVEDHYIYDYAFSPDGNYLALFSPRYWGNAISLIKVATGEVLLRITNGGSYRVSAYSVMEHVSFSPDSKLVAFGLNGGVEGLQRMLSGNGIVLVYDIDKREKVWQTSGVSEINDFSFSPQGNLFAFTSDLGRTITVWDTNEWKLVKELSPGTETGHAQLKFSPDGKKILATNSYRSVAMTYGCFRNIDFIVNLWDLEAGAEPIFSAPGGTNFDQSMLDFSPDGKYFLYAEGLSGCNEFFETKLVVVELSTLKRIAEFPLRTVTYLTAAPNVIISGSATGQVSLWSGTTGELIRSFGTDSGIITSIMPGYTEPSGLFKLLVTTADRLDLGVSCVNTKTQLWNSEGYLVGTIYEGSFIHVGVSFATKISGYCITYEDCDRATKFKVIDASGNVVCNTQACMTDYWCGGDISSISIEGRFDNRWGNVLFRDNPTIVITRTGGIRSHHEGTYAFDIWGFAP